MLRPICLTRPRMSITSCNSRSRRSRRRDGLYGLILKGTPSLTSHDQFGLDSYQPFLTAHGFGDLQPLWWPIFRSLTLASTLHQRCMHSVQRPRFHVPRLTLSLPQTPVGSKGLDRFSYRLERIDYSRPPPPCRPLRSTSPITTSPPHTTLTSCLPKLK